MKAKDARALNVGDRVQWTGPDGPAGGHVADRGYAAFRVQWDDGQTLMFPFENNEPQLAHLEAA